MPLAARVEDRTTHGVLTPTGAAATVLIGGFPAAVVGTVHVCAVPPPAGPHPSSPVAGPGCPTVLIEGRPAARAGDLTACGPVTGGCPSVRIGG